MSCSYTAQGFLLCRVKEDFAIQQNANVNVANCKNCSYNTGSCNSKSLCTVACKECNTCVKDGVKTIPRTGSVNTKKDIYFCGGSALTNIKCTKDQMKCSNIVQDEFSR